MCPLFLPSWIPYWLSVPSRVFAFKGREGDLTRPLLDFEGFFELGKVARAVAGELRHVFQADAAEFEVV